MSARVEAMPAAPRSAGGPAPGRGRDRSLALALRAAAPLPLPAAECALGSFALAQGLMTPHLRRRALAWAAWHATGSLARQRLAWRLLYNRGRFLALRSVTALTDPARVRPRVVTVGVEHLEGAEGGAGVIILVFHLGPHVTTLGLRLAGRRTIAAGDHDGLAWPRPRTAWRPLIEGRHEFVELRPDGGGAASLFRVRRLLLAGETVILAGDGHSGADAFPIALPGATLMVRRAWWSLRRQTGARVVPAFGHVDGSRLVGTFHPPLPPPQADAEADLEACRAALSPLVANHVARHPEQCLSLALAAPHGGAA